MNQVRVGALCLSLWLAGCGGVNESAGFSNPPPAPAPVSPTLSGKVFAVKPNFRGEWIAGVVVTLKDYQGNHLGTATTDAEGFYSLPGDLPAGPYFAEARTSLGPTLYGVGDENTLNLTPLTDFVIREYYRALGLDPATVFAGLSPADPKPDPEDVSDAAEAIIENVEVAVDLPGAFDPTTSPLEAPFVSLLSGLTFGPGGVRVTAPNGEVQESQVSVENFELVGTTTVTPPGEPAQALPVRQALATYAAPDPNGAWMARIASKIGPNRLADTILPGTHDSASAGVGLAAGGAVTQFWDLEVQLNKGIRYLDLRITEASHSGNARRDDFRFHHLLLSYSVPQGLQMIKNYLVNKQQDHGMEIIHLDVALTNLVQNSKPDVQELLKTIQAEIGPYMIPSNIPEVDWRNHTLQQIWDYNRAHGTHYQVVVTWPYWGDLPDNELKNLVWNDSNRHSQYWEVNGGNVAIPPNEIVLMKNSVDVQLSDRFADFKMPDGRLGGVFFQAFRTAQQNGQINVLQCVTTPSVLRSIEQALFPSNFPGSLLDFGSITNENFANYAIDSPVVEGRSSGWLGQRLWASHYGNPAQLQNGQWNRANVVMVDSFDYPYKPLTWPNMRWDGQKRKWVKTEETNSFVNQVVNANLHSGETSSAIVNPVVFTGNLGNLAP